MKRTLFIVLFLSSLFATAISAMQPIPATQPAIIVFTSDVASITGDDAEAGQSPAILSWYVVGLTEGYDLFIQAYLLDTWNLLPTEEALPPIGSYPLTIQHPLNFGPPTYRLVITDQNVETVAERILTIPYNIVETEKPTINAFTSTVAQVDINALAQGATIIPVVWEVANRLPTTNLVFEQVHENGQTVSVELPRPNLWIPSSGQGPIRPVRPLSGNLVRLRLRLVDMEDGAVYDERELTISVVGTMIPSPKPGSSNPPRPTIIVPTATALTSQAQIVSFTVSPQTVDRGGTVTLNWEVRNASSMSVWKLAPSGQIADFLESPPFTGSWTVTLSSNYVDFATFPLWAADASGAAISSSVTVQVRCPFTYFFSARATGTETCPLSAARDVDAVFQSFERGFMVWIGDRRFIYVFYTGGSLGRYSDTWTPGEVFDTGEPPAGLLRPERGFGKVWTNELGVRDRIGWATGPEQAYTVRTQTSGADRYPYTYITLPDARIVYLVESSWGAVGQ